MCVHCYRYNLGSMQAKFFIFRCYLGCSSSAIGFIQISFLLRYLQVFVWGRVKEINEDLAMRAVGIANLCVNFGLMYCMRLNPPITTYFMSFSQLDSKKIPVPLHFCSENCSSEFVDVMNQRFV